MPRMPERFPPAGSEYTGAESQRRWWQARIRRAATHTRAWPSPPGRAPPRSGTQDRWQTRRPAEKCTADRAPGAAPVARNRHSPASPRRPQTREDSLGAKSSTAQDSVRSVDLLGDVLERGVADVLAVNHIDHVLADILGVIADALQRAHDPHDFERAPNGARVLHHEGDALTVNRLILLVHHLVFPRGLERSLGIHAGKRVERVMHHLRDLSAEVFHFPVLVRGPLHGGEPRGDVADFLALIADALQIGDGLDDGDDHPQVSGSRRADRQYAAALLVDRHLHAVDLVIVGRDRFAQAAVAFDQGGDRLVQLLLHEPAHLQHLVANLFQVFVEAARNVVGEVGRFHKNYLRSQDLRTLKMLASAARNRHVRPLRAPAARACCARLLRAPAARVFIYIRLQRASTLHTNSVTSSAHRRVRGPLPNPLLREMAGKRAALALRALHVEP